MFNRSCQPQNLLFRDGWCGNYVSYFGFAPRQCASLIQQYSIYLMCPFQRLTTSNENTVFCSFASADDDSCRRNQAQSTGAGNNQYGHKIKQSVSPRWRWPKEKPDNESHNGNYYHHRHEVAGKSEEHTSELQSRL